MAQPYTREEIRLSAKTTYCEGLIPSRVLATVEQGFAPGEPTDEELDLWASAKTTLHNPPSTKFRPSNELGHAIQLARAFHLGIQVIQKLDWELSVIGFTHEDIPSTAPSFRLYQGASLADAARAITLHLWRVNRGNEL